MERSATITGLLIQWSEGNQAALADLAPQVHKELRTIAKLYLGRGRPNQTLQPTALINEAWLRLIDQSKPLRCESRAHFYGIAARLMRLVLVDYSRARNAAKRGRGFEIVSLDDGMAVCENHAIDVLAIDEALDELAKIDARKGRVIELRYFGGMEREEISTALGMTLATVKRDLRLGEAWLRRFLLT